jgi:hypothetical protein
MRFRRTPPSDEYEKARCKQLQRAFVLRARGEIRTPTPEGTTPSRWRVYQFHHVRKRQLNLVFGRGRRR